MQHLRAEGAADIPVFCGGGGTITGDEARTLERLGVQRVYLPRDGLALGLDGMALDLIERSRRRPAAHIPPVRSTPDDDRKLGRVLSMIESGNEPVLPETGKRPCPVLAVTGIPG
ncbi:MAG: hypothetical protein U9R74_17415 [Pseudomonadota bacterium]|nr:hypothetical protein [Pseudomonadota bacterium]